MSNVIQRDKWRFNALNSFLFFSIISSFAIFRFIFLDFLGENSILIFYSLFIFGSSLFLATPIGILPKQFIVLLYVVVVIVLQIFLPVLSGPDEVRFHKNVSEYSIGELIGSIKSSFDISKPSFVSSALTFSTYVRLLSGSATKAFPELIAVLNCSALLYSSSLFVRSVKISYGTIVYSEKTFLISVFAFLMLSPSSIYWSATYAKDITSLAFCLFAAVMLFQKRILLFLIFLVLATSLRVYAIVPIILYYICLSINFTYIKFSVVFSVILLFVITDFNIIILMNLVLATAFLFISPNPLNQANWMLLQGEGTWVFSPLWFTLEGIVLGVFFVIGLAFLVRGIFKKDYTFVLLYLSILCCASILVLVGYHLTVVSLGDDYRFGKLGENLVRKKFIVWPIIALWIGLIVDRLWRSLTFLFKR